MTRRKKTPPPPTREEQRLADNARPLSGELDPAALCATQRERPMLDKDSNCWVCAYLWSGLTTHCHLYERCDRCRDEANPCDTGRQFREFNTRFPDITPAAAGPKG